MESRLALAVTLLDENFQDDVVGTQPNSADQFWNSTGPNAFIQVAGPGGAYTAPFGGSGNKVLVVDTPGAAQPIVSWRSMFPDDATAFRNGSIEFDLYMPPAGSRSWTFFDFRLGYGGPSRTAPTTVGDTTVWTSFRLNPGAPQGFVLDDNTGSFLSAFTPSTVLHVRYDLNGTSETYRLSINGVQLSVGGNPDRPWRAGALGVNMMAIYGAFPATSAPIYVDNLKVVNADSDPVPWAPPADEPTDVLQWHQHRGNQRLTGEASLHQDIAGPGAGVLWSDFIGSREAWTAVAPSAGQYVVPTPTQSLGMSQADRMSWGIGGPYFDLAGNGTLVPEATSSIRRIGDFIPGNGTLEKLEGEVLDPTFGQGVIRLSIYQSGSWVQQWQSPQIPSMFGIPNISVGDFDNDGTNEVAVVPWTNLYLLNINTGAIERTGTFKPAVNESGRGYGWLGAYDLTGDGREEMVVMGDFQDFITVMGWDGSGNLVQLWTKVYSAALAGKQTAHRPMAFPVRDLTGDGNAEIATSVYNEVGDGKWHTLVYNALTGTPLNDLVDHVIDGSRDVNGDGDFELFVQTTVGSLIPGASTVKILDWNGVGFSTLWSQESATFVRRDIQDFPLNVNGATSTGKSDLLTGPISPGGQDVFFTRRIVDAAASEFAIDGWQLDGAGGATALATATGVNVDVLSVRAVAAGQTSVLLGTEVVGAAGFAPGDYDSSGVVDGGDLLTWQRQLGSIRPPLTGADGSGNGVVDGADLTIWRTHYGEEAPHALHLSGWNGAPTFAQLGSPPRSSVVVGRLDGPSSAPTVVVQGGSETIVALQPASGGEVAHSWTRAGIGGFTGATQFQGQHEFSGVALADVNGDGKLETLYATKGESGQARLVAAAPDGSIAWFRDFDVPGGPRVWNQAGLTLWRTGRFRSEMHADVLVQIMRGSGGTGEFQLLDGVTGAVVWTRTYGNTPGSSPVQRNAGEGQMAVYDWDGDGLDEAVNVHPDMFYVIDGNGENLIDKSIYNGGVFPGGSPLYGTPIVADFRNNGTDTILFAGSYSQLGLMTKTGAPVWYTPFVFDNTPGFIQGVGDVDGDGKLELLSVAHPSAPGVDTQSRFYAIDAATGAVEWSINLPGRAHAPVGGAYFDTPTLSVSGDVDNDGRVESIFAIGATLYVVGANPGGTSGQIEWSYTPDGGALGSPVLADADGDGRAEIIVVSGTGYVYGIGKPPAAAAALPTARFASANEASLAWAGALSPWGSPIQCDELLASTKPLDPSYVCVAWDGKDAVGVNPLTPVAASAGRRPSRKSDNEVSDQETTWDAAWADLGEELTRAF